MKKLFPQIWVRLYISFGWDCIFHVFESYPNKRQDSEMLFHQTASNPVPPNQKILVEKEMTTPSDLQTGVPAAFGLRAFCVQKIIGIKIWTTKSQVSPYELNPDSEMLPVTRIPRQREKHHEAWLSALLFNHVQREWFYPSGINTHCWTGTYLHLPVVLFALWEVRRWEHASS